MTQPAPDASRLSLAQHFDAPDDHTGVFGWICGYSADAVFLDDALERFTRQSHAQRAYDGRISMTLLLDPGNPQLPYVDAPGVAHVPMLDLSNRPFALLHAKVALLGFRSETYSDHWLVRLVVSTGNWTRQTLEQSLDLAWCIEASSEELAGGGSDIEQRCADIGAARHLIDWLAEHFDLRMVESLNSSGRLAESALAKKEFSAWLTACSHAAGAVVPRFFDNRRGPLLTQIPEKLRAFDSNVRRNYLAMGSGFYEAPTTPGILPVVPLAIRNALKDEGLLTATAEVDLFVDPAGCQAIAQSVKALTEAGFRVRPAASPEAVFGNQAGRALHAKFLFSANWRETSSYCSSPWLYIGSGNLTGPGVLEAASQRGGNLEAGVVFVPGTVFWEPESDTPAQDVITNVLPLQSDKHYSGNDEIAQGDGFLERPDEYLSGPVAWLVWNATPDGGRLSAPVQDRGDYDVLDDKQGVCVKRDDCFIWPYERPRQVLVRWQVDNKHQWQCHVPVVDEFGRVAGTALPSVDIDRAWWQLADFPLPPALDDDPDEDADDDNGKGKEKERSRQRDSKRDDGVGAYPIRQMMELVEHIAAKQTEILQHDWPAWCSRLEQTLAQAAGAPAIKAFVDLELNPLSPLRATPFRPAFAESSQTGPGQMYEVVLARVEKVWGVSELTAIGEAS